ncbi:Anti-lipopolysaccharide factor [Chionoecetes opilio]|uniref:Anti-lipopolysaccharide factor n=1 Tax=Chionoecetes opilio TaxID=41210 RepID=A0A8J5C015_CHIOP|nr:Anti-lipopolysaccharide factor [Chionoecetes opilio]
MRSGVLAGLCVAVVVLCVCLPQPCEAQWQVFVAPIVQKIEGLWHSDHVEFMGHNCQFRRRPKIRKFKLYHEGKFWCPGWAPFDGRSRTKSRSGSSSEATKDFIRKAFSSGLVTQEDAALWLKNHR